MTASKEATVDVTFRLAVTGRPVASATLSSASTLGDISRAFRKAAQHAGEGTTASAMTCCCFLQDGRRLSGGAPLAEESLSDVVLDVVLVQPLDDVSYESNLEQRSAYTSQLKLTLSPDGQAELLDIHFDEEMQTMSATTRHGALAFKPDDSSEFDIAFTEEEEVFVGEDSPHHRAIQAMCTCRITDDSNAAFSVLKYESLVSQDKMAASLWPGRELAACKLDVARSRI
uniref:Uncharacterized protein n=1 Tax=Alexandrium monilatum TaxID=311494 RepID=A0A7S4QPL5_9DINO